MREKIILFPYIYQVDEIINYLEDMEYELVGITSAIEDSFVLNKQYNELYKTFEESISSCDCILFLDNERNLKLECYTEKIRQAIALKKKILMSAKLKQELYQDIEDIEESITVMDSQDISIKKYESVSLQEMNVPIITVMGVGEECSKFEVLLHGKRTFENAGYKVLAYSFNQFSFLFGIEYYPNFIFNPDLKLNEKIVALNSYVSEAVKQIKPDVIIMGVPGGILPINKYIHNYFGEIAYIVGNAFVVDMGILCSYFATDMDAGYVSELSDMCKYKFNTPQLSIYISNNKMKIDSENKYELGVYHLSKETISRFEERIEQLNNVFCCINKHKELDLLWEHKLSSLQRNINLVV